MKRSLSTREKFDIMKLLEENLTLFTQEDPPTCAYKEDWNDTKIAAKFEGVSAQVVAGYRQNLFGNLKRWQSTSSDPRIDELEVKVAYLEDMSNHHEQQLIVAARQIEYLRDELAKVRSSHQPPLKSFEEMGQVLRNGA